MSDDKLIGLGTCPACKGPGARITFSRKKFAVLTCGQGACRLQIFARSEAADDAVRAWVVSAPKVEPAPPAAEPKPEPKPAPSPSRADERDSWDVF